MRAALLAAMLAAGPASARTLLVGEGREFPLPGLAIDAAQDGDTISIAPGSYFGCGVIGRSRVTIEGEGDGVVLTDRTCQGKALLVITGDGVTVRRLTLARARVPDGNGAGIRLEASSVLIQQVTFSNDQVGLLAAAPGGTIRIEDSSFVDGGTAGNQALAAVMTPAASLLRITGSTFRNVEGSQIQTAAARVELIGNTIALGGGGTPGAALWAGGGQLLLEDNVFSAGPQPPPRGAAVMLLDDAQATLRRNRLENTAGVPLALLLDWSWGHPTLEGNTVAAGDVVSSSSGVWRHRISAWVHGIVDQLRGVAGRMKRLVSAHLR